MTDCLYLFFFFFKAKAGIRVYKVTGVQTCALPILVMAALIVSDDRGRHHHASCGVRIHSREGEDGPFVNHPLQSSLDGPGREAQLLRHGRVWFLRVSSESSNHVPIGL